MEKIVDIIHNQYQGFGDVTDDEDFDESELGWEGASEDIDIE